jgi:hypothetical protein
MIRGVRWTYARCFRSQTWITPTVVFALVAAIAYTGGAPYYRSAAIGGAVATVFGAWLMIASAGGHPGQRAIGAVAVRGAARLRLAEGVAVVALVTAYALAGHVLSLLRDPDLSQRSAPGFHLVALCALYLLGAVTGVAIGAVTSPPVIRGRTMTFVLAALGTVLYVAVPGSPVLTLITLASQDHFGPGDPGRLVFTLVVGLGLAALELLVALRFVRRRA